MIRIEEDVSGRRKINPSATLSATNPTWTGLWLNPGPRNNTSKKPPLFFLDRKGKISVVYAGIRVVEVYLHAFIFLELRASDWTASRPGCFIPREIWPTLHFTGDWVGFVVGNETLGDYTNIAVLRWMNQESLVVKLVAISNKRLPQKVKYF